MSARKTNKSSSRSRLVLLVVTLLCVVLAGWLLLNRQYVVDQLAVWQYQPSDQVARVADRSSMNQTGKFYFYASHPKIEDSQRFNAVCERQELHAAILGCYSGQNIYIYDIDNPQLDGIKAVTAAHEMLHAAYFRLSPTEKSRVDNLLQQQYQDMQDSQDWTDRLDYYQRAEPGERMNELHSMIGTEVGQINPELEDYYQQYFEDRRQVVDLYEQYSGVFEDLQQRGQELADKLTGLADSLDGRIEQYNAASRQLQADFAQFNQTTENNGFRSSADYQAQRSQLLAERDRLNTERAAVEADLQQYESWRQELLEVASQSEALNRSIDSSLAPAPSL